MNFFSAADLVASIVGASSAKRDLSSEAPEDEGPSQKKKVKLSDQNEDENKSSDEVEEVNEDDKLAIRQVVVATNFCVPIFDVKLQFLWHMELRH
jgi:hypothetical protein